MAQTPNRDINAPRFEEETEYDDLTPNFASTERRVRYANDRFSMRDAAGEFNPRNGWTQFVIPFSFTIPSGWARMMHDPELADGVEITIASGGEMLVL